MNPHYPVILHLDVQITKKESATAIVGIRPYISHPQAVARYTAGPLDWKGVESYVPTYHQKDAQPAHPAGFHVSLLHGNPLDGSLRDLAGHESWTDPAFVVRGVAARSVVAGVDALGSVDWAVERRERPDAYTIKVLRQLDARILAAIADNKGLFNQYRVQKLEDALYAQLSSVRASLNRLEDDAKSILALATKLGDE